MTNTSHRKGGWAERDIAALLSVLLGREVRRKLGAGRADDTGDLAGIPGTTAQVAWWPKRGVLRAVREKPVECERQRVNDGAARAVTFVRLVGGEWRAVLTVEQWLSYHHAIYPPGPQSLDGDLGRAQDVPS